MTKPSCWRAFVLVAAAAFAAAAHADLTVYSGRAAFLAAASNPGTDTFDDLPLSTETAIDDPLARVAGPYTYSIDTVGGNNGLYTVAGPGSDVWMSTADSSEALILIGFAPAVRAVGGFFFATALDGSLSPGQTVRLQVIDGGGQATTYVLVDPGADSFVGFVSTLPFVSLTVRIDDEDIFATINDIVLATAPVPEPATPALWLAGLTLAALRVRCRRRAARA